MKKFLAFFALCLALCLTISCVAVADTTYDHGTDEGDEVHYATCTEDGWRTYIDETTGKTERQVLPKTGHEFDVDAKDAYWNNKDNYVVIQEAKCATNTPEIRKYTCHHIDENTGKECGATITKEVPAEHIWSSDKDNEKNWGIVIVEPTCSAEGSAIDYCTVCGVKREKVRVIEKTSHMWVAVVDVMPTCKTAGKGHVECKNCGIKATEKDDIGELTVKVNGIDTTVSKIEFELPIDEKNGHDWDAWVTKKPATCESAMVREHWCKICGLNITETYKPEKADETYTADGFLQPVWGPVEDTLLDCFTKIRSKVCVNCGGKVDGHKVYVDENGKIVSEEEAKYTVSAHQYNHSTTIYKDKAAAEKAEKTFVDYVAPATVDTNEDGYINCEDAGYIEYACIHADDGKDHPTDKVIIPAPGHKYTDWQMVYAPGTDGAELGYWVRTCTVETCKHSEHYYGANAPTGATELKNGLQKDADGKYRFYTNDKVDTSKTGIVTFEGGEFFVANGELCDTANGLNQNVDGKWYFLSQGQIQRVSQFAEYDGAWFVIKNGELDTSANGLLDYNGGKFIFAAGKLTRGVNGLWQNTDGSWYYVADGQVVSYTGLAQYDGAWFYVVDGKLAENYSGTVSYNGGEFNVVNGTVVADAE